MQQQPHRVSNTVGLAIGLIAAAIMTFFLVALRFALDTPTVLERAQLPPTVQRLAFRAADGYVDSFPIEYAMMEHVLVAYLHLRIGA